MKKHLALLLVASVMLGLVACGSPAASSPVSAAAESGRPAPSTLVYGSGDYTRINPAIDEH
ncbi:MAG: ABC transporter substrate-binding protein, partial [Ruthenibacterium sp.]